MTADNAPTTTDSDDDIQAAIAEAESLSASRGALDTNAAVVPVPVDGDQSFARPSDTRGTDIGALVTAVGDVESAERVETPPAVGTAQLIGRWIYAAVDRTLWALNYPFAQLRPATRQIIGLVAIVTIITSLLASVLMPSLFPRRDAINTLQDRVQSLNHAVNISGG